MISITARNAGLLRMRQLARGLPIDPEPAVAPSVAFAALAVMHSLCGQLLEVIGAMESEAVDLKAIRVPAKQIAAIVDVVADVAGRTKGQLLGDRRARSVARPRQVAMLLCKELTAHSLPTIGRHIGNRDHSTVMHAVKVVSERLAAGDPDTTYVYTEAKRRLQA